MIVEITSCAPVVAFRKPAIPAQAAPASAAATIAEQDVREASASSTNETPTQFATTSPTRYWPWPPMLKRPQRNAKATASPVRISVVVCSSVWLRLNGVEADRVRGPGWKNQLSPAPSKMPL